MQRRRFHMFARAQQGVAALEFALILPMMLLMVFGGEEFARFLIIQEKAEKVATSVADIVAQETSVTQAELDDILNAASQEMSPFPFGTTNGKVIVSSVTQTGAPTQTNVPKVSWQYTGPGVIAAGSKIGAAGSNANLPVGFTMQDKDNIIVTEVFYVFTPLFAGMTPLSQRTLYEMSIFKPRLGSLTNAPS